MGRRDTELGVAPRDHTRAWSGLACALVLSCTTPPQARACDVTGCIPEAFTPRDGSAIPANVPAFAWRPTVEGTPASMPRLVRVDAAGEVALELQERPSGVHWLVLLEPLEPGARYRLEHDDACATTSVEFEARDPAPLPASAGELMLGSAQSRQVRVATGSGSCIAELPAVAVDAALVSSDGAEPWAGVLLYRWHVDDAPWRPDVQLGPDPEPAFQPQTVLFAACLAGLPSAEVDDHIFEFGLDQGDHDLQLQVELPGVGTLWTDRVRLRLDCDDVTVVPQPGAMPSDPDAGDLSDASVPPRRADAGASEGDESATPLAQGAGISDASGCMTSRGLPTRAAASWLVAAGAALIALRRRR